MNPALIPVPVFTAVSWMLSTSGCTMFSLLLKTDGFPKNMNSFPGSSFPYIHFIPLKNTSSIIPLPSDTVTFILFTALNLISCCRLPSPLPWPAVCAVPPMPDAVSPPVPGSTGISWNTGPAVPYSSLEMTFARIWICAMSGTASAMRMTELLSMYLYGYRRTRSPNVDTPSSFFRRSALLGPAPGRNCMSFSSAPAPMVNCCLRKIRKNDSNNQSRMSRPEP